MYSNSMQYRTNGKPADAFINVRLGDVELAAAVLEGARGRVAHHHTVHARQHNVLRCIDADQGGEV